MGVRTSKPVRFLSVDRTESDEEDDHGQYTTVVLDGWLRMRVNSYYVASIKSLRHRLAQCFSAKVANPRAPLEAVHSELLVAVGKVLSKEWEESGLDHSKKWSKPPTDLLQRQLPLLLLQ